MTTSLPGREELEQLKASNFRYSGKDIYDYLRVIELIRPFKGCRVFEYGSSWGYGVWQLRSAGYSVVGYEISHERAKFGRNFLQVDVLEYFPEVRGQFDLVFSSHVLEHVPSVRNSLDRLAGILKPGGMLVIFTPNGSKARKLRDPAGWKKSWGGVHPNLLTDEYYKKQFFGWQLLLTSSPYRNEELMSWKHRDAQCRVFSLSGDELLAVVRKPGA